MPVERDRVGELIDAEPMLGKAGDFRTEQPAAGREDQPIVGERLLAAVCGGDLNRHRFGVDGLRRTLHEYDIDRPKDVP